MLTRQFPSHAENLSDAYTAQLPEKLGRSNSVETVAGDRWDEEGFQTLHRMVHSLTDRARLRFCTA